MSKSEFEQQSAFALSRRGSLKRGAQAAGASVLASVTLMSGVVIAP